MKSWVLSCVFRVWTYLSSATYAAEGVNIPLRVMPTRFVAATLRRYGACIGQDVRFLAPVTVHNACTDRERYYANLNVGNDCYFGRELFLDLQDHIHVEDHVTISHRVMILTHTDAGNSPLREDALPTSHAPVILRVGAYIGANVTILQGVEIGECSIVAAGAVVTKLVPPHTVVAGVPAKPIRKLEPPKHPTDQ